MNKLNFYIILILIFTYIEIMANPLLKPYNTPFGVPPFDKIKNEHFQPAFEEAMKKHNKEIDDIIKNKKPANFENTIEAFENSGIILNDIATIFFNLNSANTNSEIQSIASNVAPKLSIHSDEIIMNNKLFERIKVVYNQKDKLKLNNEQKILLDETYKSFVRAGANLSEKDKSKLKEINQKLSVLSLKFGENMLKDVNTFKLIIDNKDDLKGLSPAIIATAAETAEKYGEKGKWVFTLHNPSVMPFLQYADNRDLRKKIQQAYINRGNNNNEFDNKKNIDEIIKLRIEKANLLGYKTYAEYSLVETMAKTTNNVMDLLNRAWNPALEMAKKEREEMQKLIDKEGGNFKLEAWDWRYYAEKVRKAKYDLDEGELKPYLSLDNVKNGIFEVVKRLYGVTFKEIKDIPKYHNECQVYEVINQDGKHLAILYMDFHPRDSKRSGAWMTNYREQHFSKGKNVAPIISLVCNFTKPSGNTPSLLTWDEAETFFHEFGHGLHGMFSSCHYKSLAGTNVVRDFVELPSQIMEHWIAEPAVLKLFAKHYKTGEVIPDALIDKLNKSSYFNQGFITTEMLASALLDMKYHTLEQPLSIPANDFQNKVSDEINLIPEISYRHGSTHFSHIFSGGYSAGYYSYTWSNVLDCDAYEAFKEKGIFNKSIAESFRNNILARGKTDDPKNLYRLFRGRDPKIEPFLKSKGFIE